MGFHLLRRLTLLFVLLGLALADKGVAPLEVIAVSMHGELGGRWTYHDNSTLHDNGTAASPTKSIDPPSSKMDRWQLKAELTNMIIKEPGFALLSLSIVLISGGMVVL